MSQNYQTLQKFLSGQCCCPQNGTSNRTFAANLSLPPNNKFMDPKVINSIPTTFSSLEEYLDSFKWPLIEEVRANIHQSLGQIYKAPLIAVRSKGEGHVKEATLKQIIFSLESYIDSFQPVEMIYLNPRPYDLILLCTVEPGKVKQSQGFCMLALVQYGFLNDKEAGEGEKLIEVLIHENHKPLIFENLEWYAIYVASFGTAFRTWNSLNPLTHINPYPVIQVTLELWTEVITPSNASIDSSDINEYIFKYCENRKMNESQRNTVTQIAFHLLKWKACGVNMIQGPPGTGKTSTLIALLSVLSCLDYKCLVCAPTNIAVATVALRFMCLLGSKASFFEYCSISTDHINMNIKSINLCDLILVGDRDKILIHDDLKDIYLPYRAECLSECLGSSKNWGHGLLNFLISAVSNYEIYLEQASQSENEKPLTFIQFIRKSLTTMVENLTRNINILALHLPNKVVNKNKFMEISNLARKFLQFVEKTNIPDMKLGELFGDVSLPQGLMGSNKKDSFMSTQDEFHTFLVNKRNLTKKLKDILKETDGLVSAAQSVRVIEDLCLKNSSIVFSTVSSSGYKSVKKLKSFDCAIIDEAGQLVEAESCIVTEFQLKFLVLVGDHKQLPATVISKVAKESGYGRSLFKRLQTLRLPCHFLDTQYRMHPEISIFPRVEFYESHLKDGENVTGESYAKIYQQLYGPYAFINVADGTEEQDETSIKNVVEANVVVYMANQLNDVCAQNNISDLNVGIITPYQSQVQLITELFEERRKLNHIILKIKSVDGFQGQEEDVIIFSTVRSNRKNMIGFVEDTHRLNVALTRARYCLWVVGNTKALTQADLVWKKLVTDAKKRVHYVDPSDHHGLKRVIVKSKEQLNQMADLLKTDSIVFKNTLWKVIFSENFKNTIVRLQPISKRLQLLNTILNIANGLHQRQKIQDVPGLELFSKIINIQKAAGLCLVWTIDVERGELVQQIIKIWDAVSFSNVTSLIKRLNAAFFTYSVTYLERCKARQISRTNRNIVLPSKWKLNRDLIWYRSPIYTSTERGSEENYIVENGKQGVSERTSVSESLLLMKFYSFATASIDQILAANDGSELTFPFEISEHEREIVQYPLSCFIIGRSGTGKTTVLVSKLHRREQEIRILQHGINTKEEIQGNNIPSTCPLRQILVTLNPKLCTAIKFQLSQIQSSLSQNNTNLTEEPDFEDEDDVYESIPDRFTNLAERFYPMVITYKKFLRMLDGSVPSPFLIHNNSSIPHQYTDKLIIDIELEDSYSDSLDESEDQERKSIPGTREEESISEMNKVSGREMDFAYFCSKYWPHFNSGLTKKFDPSQVFAEIISSIKGSIQAMKSEKGRLRRDSYLDISETRSSSFSREERNDIYKLFLQYEEQRIVRNDYDVSDHVFHLYRQLHNGAFLGDKIHFVYIDEIQDLTQSQIALFSYICEDSSLGFTFAGDTAQTITKGVNFRFEDLASLFFKEFCRNDKWKSASSNVPEIPDAIPANASITINEKKKKSEKRVGQAVKVLQLTHNFRTHIGVVRLANSIVNMLYYFFPYTIDRLLPETSRICGERPVLLNVDQENFFEVLFGWGGEKKTECTFGAQQAIIVRNENQKHEILKHLGTKSLVLTIDSCKGLEFEDVLLYNFFTESALKTKWRVLYQYTSEKNHEENVSKAYRTFDAGRHSLLCSELKHLYVGVTRARRRLWIYDENSSPMLEYWINVNYMQEKLLDESFISSIQVASTPEEWRKRGTQLFNEQQYDMAMLSFERAGEPHLFEWAKAAKLQQEGEKTFDRDRKAAIESLKQAATIFQELGKVESAAKCYIKLEDYEQAGKLYLGKWNPPKFKEAGDCFAKVMLWMEAASAYSSAKYFKECLEMCFNGKMIETSLEYIEKWKGLVYLTATSETCKDSISLIIDAHLKKCAVHCHQRQNVTLMVRCVNMFSDISLKRSFLLRRDYIDELIEVEKAAGCFSEAAELAEVKGDVLQATELYIKGGNLEKALCYILISARQSVLWGNNNPGWPPTSSERSVRLLQKMQEVITHAKTEVKDQQEGIHKVLHLAELEMEILEYKGEDMPTLRRLLTEAEEKNNLRLQVLSTWKAIDICMDTINASESCADNSFLQFKSSMEKNLASLAQELLHLWNIWKQKLQLFINALERLKKKMVKIEDKWFLTFSFEHFGVEYGDHSANCIVNDYEAKWLEGNKVSIYSLQGTKGQLCIEKLAELAAGSWEWHLSELSGQVHKCVENYVKRGLHCLPNQSEISNLDRDQKYLTLEKGSLLLDLYGIAEKMECFKEAKGLITKLQLEIQGVIFPKARQIEDMLGVLKLRDDPRTLAVLGKLASTWIEIATRDQKRLTLDETCRLQMFLPFIKYAFDNKRIPQFSISICHWIWENNVLWDQYNTAEGQVEILKFLLDYGQAINLMFRSAGWKKDTGYVNPFVFLSFVETSTVMALSYFNRLHGFILPRSLALDLLTSKSQHKFYTRLLSIEKSNFTDICIIIEQTVEFCVQFLIRDVRGTQVWLSNLDAKEKFPYFVLRVLLLLLTVHVNIKDSQLVNSIIIFSLQNIFHSRSPVLASLPDQLSVLLHKMMKDIGRVTVKADIEGLSQALESIGDSLIMTKRCEKVHCCKFSYSSIETIAVEDNGGAFAFLQEKYPEMDGVAIQNSVSNVEERENIQLPHVVVLDENTDYAMTREELNEGSISHSEIEEEEPLTDLEQLRNEAKTFLLHEDGSGTGAYLDYFVSQVCPLKASLLGFSQKLVIVIPKLKGLKSKYNESDELLDELMDTNDGLVKDFKLLNPRDERHQKQDIKWLKETIEEVNKRFKLYKKTMEKLKKERLKNLLDGNEEFMAAEIHKGFLAKMFTWWSDRSASPN